MFDFEISDICGVREAFAYHFVDLDGSPVSDSYATHIENPKTLNKAFFEYFIGDIDVTDYKEANEYKRITFLNRISVYGTLTCSDRFRKVLELINYSYMGDIGVSSGYEILGPTITDMHGLFRASVVEWTYGFIAYTLVIFKDLMNKSRIEMPIDWLLTEAPAFISWAERLPYYVLLTDFDLQHRFNI